MQKRHSCCNNYRKGENINKPMIKFQIQKLKYFGFWPPVELGPKFPAQLARFLITDWKMKLLLTVY